jgi:hypothetical protein
MTAPNSRLPLAPWLAAAALALPLATHAQPAAFPPPPRHDGAHDFDFLLGDWKAHVLRLPDRLVGSTAWIEYKGISRHHSVLGSSANFEEFEVENPSTHQRIKAQTLRLYDPVSQQWSIYGLDVDNGALGLPATVGQFDDGVGTFFDYEAWKGRMILVRYQWTHAGHDHAHMEQSFSADGGKSWEVNWICDLTRDGA